MRSWEKHHLSLSEPFSSLHERNHVDSAFLTKLIVFWLSMHQRSQHRIPPYLHSSTYLAKMDGETMSYMVWGSC
jgi:hypothetical protein